MLDTTNTKQGDTLRTQNNVNETPKSNSLIEREKIKGTEFTLIQLHNKYFITLGDARVSELYNTKEEAIAYFNDHEWEFIAKMCIHLYKWLKQQELTNVDKKEIPE